MGDWGVCGSGMGLASLSSTPIVISLSALLRAASVHRCKVVKVHITASGLRHHDGINHIADFG